MQFGTLRVYVINAKLSALNFTSVKLAKLSSQTLRKSSSFRTLCRLHEQLAKLSTLTTLHGVQFIHGFTTTVVMHQARLMLPLHLQSFGGVTRVWSFGELRIPLLHAFPAPSESSSSFEIRHSNDPNTPRGIHPFY